MSGIPEATILKIFLGETADPRFDTIAKLVTAIGGSLDGITENKKEDEIEMNAIIALKEAYESRIADIKDYIASVRRDKKILAIATGVLMAFIIFLLVLDLSVGTCSWIRY